MKRIIPYITAASVLAGCVTAPSLPKEEKYERMPIPSVEMYIGNDYLETNIENTIARADFYDTNGDGKEDMVVYYRSCRGVDEKNPVAAFDLDKRVLYEGYSESSGLAKATKLPISPSGEAKDVEIKIPGCPGVFRV